MSTTQINATELITNLAEQHITNAIVNAAKGKTNKRSKKMTLADEIRGCFDIEKFLNDATATIEDLINRKIEEALASEKPTKKRAYKKGKVQPVVVDEVVEKPTDEVIEKPTDEVIEKPTDEVIEKPTDEVIEKPTDEVVEKKTKKPRVSKKDKPNEVADSNEKPKKKVTKKDKSVEVSDSDASETDDKVTKKTKRTVKKKIQTPIIENVIEPGTTVEPELQNDIDNQDDSSVKTSDFIQPLSISNELEEEELSDIE